MKKFNSRQEAKNYQKKMDEKWYMARKYHVFATMERGKYIVEYEEFFDARAMAAKAQLKNNL